MIKCNKPSDLPENSYWVDLASDDYTLRQGLDKCATAHNLLVDQINDRLNKTTPR